MVLHKNIKSLFRIFTITVLLFSLVSSYGIVYANENSIEQSDNNRLGEAKALVNQLLVDKTMPSTENGVSLTRAEFVTFIVDLFCYDNVAVDNISFNDIDLNGDLYSVLCQAVANGYISDSKNFRPDDAITWNEAIKICCSVAGYDTKAIYMGGFPDGYIRVASDEKLLKNCNMSGNVDSEMALQLVWNTLNANMLEAASFSTKSIEFSETRTVLEAYFDICVIEGIVNANEYTEFGDASRGYSENEIQISGAKFYTKYKLSNDYLGYNVRAYCKNDDDNEEIILVYPEDNRVLELDSAEVEYNESNKSIEYGDVKIKKAQLNGGFEYIYNNKVSTANSEFIPERGKIILIDNNDDGKYDVVSVEEYYYMAVEAVNNVYLTLTDKNDYTKKLTLDANDTKYFIYNNVGEEISFTKVKNGDIVAVLRSKDSQYIEIVKCEQIISGNVESIFDEGKKITVDGKEYVLDSEFYEKNKAVMRAGKTYTFILGMYGEIATWVNNTDDYMYGYVYKAFLDESFDSITYLKVFTQNAEHQKFACAEKLYVDEYRQKSEDAYYLFNGNPQLIRYKLDSEGNIKRIDTAVTKTDYDFDERKKDGDNLTAYNIASSYGTYYNGFFGGYFNVSSSIIFNIPTDLTKVELFSIGNNFITVNYSGSDIVPYNMDISGSPEVVVYNGATKKTGTRSPVLMVEDICMALDPDDEVKYRIDGWSDGEFVQLFVSSDETVIPSSGDIIRYTLINDEMCGIKIDFKAENLSFSETDLPANIREHEMRHYQMGSVYSVKDGYALISNTKDSGGSYLYNASELFNVKIPSKIAIYERWSKTIRNGDANYIKRYLGDGNNSSYMVVYQSYFNSNYAFVYIDE